MNQENNQEQKHLDIIIYGAGIVGLSLALALKNAGFKIALISKQELSKEKTDKPLSENIHPSELKVSALSRHSLDLLSSLGCESTINQFASFFQYMKVVDDQQNLSFDFAAQDFDSSLLFRNPNHHMTYDFAYALGAVIPNKLIEKRLERLAFDSKLDYFRIDSHQADIEITSSCVRVEWENFCLKSELIIGADGANSPLRKIAGIEQLQKKYHQKALVCYLKMEKPNYTLAWQNFIYDKTLAFLPCVRAFNNPHLKVAKHKEKPAYHYSIVWTMNTKDYEKRMNASDQELKNEIESLSHHQFGKVISISKKAGFDLIKRQAKSYAGKRVFLVGDAAHTIHPLAGMGLNLGLIDVQALTSHLTYLKDKNKTIYDYKNLRDLAQNRFLDNQFAQNLMDGFAWFYHKNIPAFFSAINKTNWTNKAPKTIKTIIIKYAQGKR